MTECRVAIAWDGFTDKIYREGSEFCCKAFGRRVNDRVYAYEYKRINLTNSFVIHHAQYCFDCGAKIVLLPEKPNREDRELQIGSRATMKDGRPVVMYYIRQTCCSAIQKESNRSNNGHKFALKLIADGGCKHCGCDPFIIK